jgi:choline dehydrogenase-like flavoprotein
MARSLRLFAIARVMFSIRYNTVAIRPDLTVTLRTNVRGWENDIPGNYVNDGWQFDLSEVEFGSGVAFKFVLKRFYWMNGDDFFLQPVAGGVYEFFDGQVQFPPMQEMWVENSYLQQLFFPPNLDESVFYDVIVVGSGIGGGILADQLSDLNLNVLVLEAGSYLFPTHIANLPRQHQIGQFDKHVWGLWDEFQIRAHEDGPGSQYIGAQGFNLGGRSIFWGGLIPRMATYEMEPWPQDIKWYLEDGGYAQAEDLMNRSPTPPSLYHERIKRESRLQFPELQNFDAPVAVQYNNGSLGTIPVGMFSTADLLMESRLTDSAQGNNNLTINLNHSVTNLLVEGNRITGVTAYDLISNVERTYHANTVVLCAGTIESAKIALLSQLNNDSGKIGVGLTDHPIFFTHFAVPQESPYFSDLDNSKLMFQHRRANVEVGAHPYNIVLELGADFNQGRYVDDDLLASHRDMRGRNMLCEIVFLLDAPLEEGNTLTQVGPSAMKPVVQMQPSPISGAVFNEMNDIKNRMLAWLQAVPLPGRSLDLQLAGLGGVAHEVGTLRMGEDPNASVVDTDLKFHGYDNLYACDLSVFPTSPAANPTLTLAALAIRLAEHLGGMGV